LSAGQTVLEQVRIATREFGASAQPSAAGYGGGGRSSPIGTPSPNELRFISVDLADGANSVLTIGSTTLLRGYWLAYSIKRNKASPVYADGTLEVHHDTTNAFWGIGEHGVAGEVHAVTLVPGVSGGNLILTITAVSTTPNTTAEIRLTLMELRA
jgi:hypothetical protein